MLSTCSSSSIVCCVPARVLHAGFNTTSNNWKGYVLVNTKLLLRQNPQLAIMARKKCILCQGVAGIFLGARNGQERVYVRCRKGFIRLAMQAGIGVAFHESHIKPQLGLADLAWHKPHARRALRLISGIWRVSVREH